MSLLNGAILATLLFVFATTMKAQPPSPNDRVELYTVVEDASELKPGENADEKIRKNFFLRAEVSKTTCFVGEPVMATFKAYSRLDANSQVVKRPSLAGFSVIEMVDAYNNQPDVEKYNGDYYYVHLIRKVQLFPLQAGDFTLEPAEVESVIQLRSSEQRNNRMRLRDFFKRGRGDPSLRKQVVFKTPELVIHVEPLPETNQPEEYSGAVGSFTVELSVDNPDASQYEPSQFTLNVKGSGNFPLITDPLVQWPDNIHASPATVKDDVNKYQFPLSGTKSFQYSVDNRDTGTYVIPPVRFVYFDPVAKSYKVAESAPLQYSVSLTAKKKKTLPAIITNNETAIPLHYYYFGLVIVVIIVVIIFMAFRKNKT